MILIVMRLRIEAGCQFRTVAIYGREGEQNEEQEWRKENTVLDIELNCRTASLGPAGYTT
jgi:hypothetical protein